MDTRPGFGDDLAAKIGLTGVSGAAFPAFTIPGLRQRSATRPRYPASTCKRPSWIARCWTALSWFRGKHAFKFGVEYRAGANDEDPRPRFRRQLHPQPADHRPARRRPARAMRWPVSCWARSTRPACRSPTRSHRAPHIVASYVQDDWRITGRLTLNRACAGKWSCRAAWRQQDELLRLRWPSTRFRERPAWSPSPASMACPSAPSAPIGTTSARAWASPTACPASTKP